MCEWEVLVLDSFSDSTVHPYLGQERREDPGGLHSRACAIRTSERHDKADAVGVKNTSCLPSSLNNSRTDSTLSPFQELQVGGHGTSESQWQLPLSGWANGGVSHYVIPGACEVFR